jgi:UDP-glucose 4-epimerase
MLKRALVTGAAGFIGSHLTDRLVREGWRVHVVDNLVSGHKENINTSLADEHVMIDDFASKSVLDRVRTGCYDYVFHLAAIPRVSFSVEHPVFTHETNVTKSLELIEACRGNITRFVFASSSSVYGGADVLPTPSTYQKNPKSPYALQKSIIEDYLRQYWMHYELDSISLRFFNVFGPRQLGNSAYSTAVSAWLTAIMLGNSMRSDGDGTQTRDLCYVDNVVDACYRAADSIEKTAASCFNVACGERTSNQEILEYLKKKYPNAKYHSAPWRAGDVMHTQADLNDIREKLGYVPVVKFWEGLDKTIEWYEKNWETVKNYEAKKC